MELFDVNEIFEGVFCITENYYQSWNKANIYLFKNSNESILVDTGTGIYNPVEFLVQKGIIKDDPKAVIATHNHFDHAGGHKYFEEFYIHENDAEALLSKDELKTLPFIANCELTSKPPGFTRCKVVI